MNAALKAALAAVLPTLRSHLSVRRLAVFGSQAHETATPASDVDILIEFDGGATLARFIEARAILEEALSRPVDLTTPNGLHPLIREQVLAEAVDVA